MKKENLIFLSIGILAIGVFAYKFFLRKNTVEIPKYGNYLSCIGNPYSMDIKLKGEMVLPKKALPSDQEAKDRLYYSAAFFQNQYTFTNLIEHNRNSALKWSSFGSELPKINVTSVEDVPYPQDVSYNYQEDAIIGFPPEAFEYLKRLIPLKKIEANEPAVKVSYEMESKLLTCFVDEHPEALESLKFYQPLDPYMAYFLVPESHRVLLKNSVRHAEGTYNPCMNPDGITASDFNPFGYWYFWRPEAKGHSDDKTPFDCTLFYKMDKNIKLVKVEAKQSVPSNTTYFNFKKFDNLNRPIGISILIGGIEGEIFQKFKPNDVKRYVNLFLTESDVQKVRSEIPVQYDIHFGKVLVLLWKIRNHIDIFSQNLETDEFSVRVTLKGKLKLSKKDVELKISLAPNNEKFPGAEKFAEYFSKDLLTNDIVVYEGHASAGGAFSLGLKELEKTKEQNQNKNMDYQILALYSCSSTYYYPPSLFPRVENQNFSRDVLRTAGAYADSAGNGSLGIIASLDQYLYNESYVPFAYWAKTFKSDNFYILSNH